MKRHKHHIAVLGGGAWGTALAAMAVNLGHTVCIYARDAAIAHAISATHHNSRYLPGICLPETLAATADPQQALKGAEIVLAAVPAQALATTLAAMKPFIGAQTPLILCCKGIERTSGRFMSQIAGDIFPDNPLAVLSGPSFAADVAQGLPTAVTLAASDDRLAQTLAHRLSGPTFRCYASTDLIGVETGGALKNVLAVAVGIAGGRRLGASAQAAVITRGFAELQRIGMALGGRAQTMTGLSVLGDLVLTCSTLQSRNYAYGTALGAGRPTAGLPLAEGVASAPVAAALCERNGIEAPLIHMVAAILAGDISIDNAVKALTTRPLKFED